LENPFALKLKGSRFISLYFAQKFHVLRNVS